MSPLPTSTRLWLILFVVMEIMLPSGRVPALPSPDWSGSAASPAVSPSGDHSSRIPVHKEKNRG